MISAKEATKLSNDYKPDTLRIVNNLIKNSAERGEKSVELFAIHIFNTKVVDYTILEPIEKQLKENGFTVNIGASEETIIISWP